MARSSTLTRQSAVSYASEVTPVALRGYLTTYVNLCWVIGQFISAGVLLGVQDRTDQWAYKIPFAVQWVWPVPLFILATFAPGEAHLFRGSRLLADDQTESPWWLVRSGKLDLAEKAIKQLSRKDRDVDAGKTVAMMVRTNQHELENAPGTSFFDCFRGSDLRRTEIACVGWAVQVLSGSSFGNQGTYFFQQGQSQQCAIEPDYADSFKRASTQPTPSSSTLVNMPLGSSVPVHPGLL